LGYPVLTIGPASAKARLGLCNLAYLFKGLIFHERCASMGRLYLQWGEPS
jgi:hypothetical protein